MTTDAARFNPDPDDSFTPAADADLAADPQTATGPDGAPLDAADGDTTGAEVRADDDVVPDRTGDGASEPPD